MVFVLSSRSGCRMILGAGSGGKTSSLRSSLGKSKRPGVTEPTLARSRQASAQFRRTAGRTHQFAPAPLHFTAISQATFPFHSFRRPQTAETVRDSGAPKDSRGRDAPHIGQDRQYGRATSSGQGISNSRGDGPAFATLRRLRLRNWPTPLGK